MHAHHEGQLDLLLGAVELDVVFDLDARRAVAGDELLAACPWWTSDVVTSMAASAGNWDYDVTTLEDTGW